MAEPSSHNSGPSTGGNTGLPYTSVKSEGFTILHNGEGDIVADVVFVHGLQGHSKRSWTKKVPSESEGGRVRKFFRTNSGKKAAVGDTGSIFWPQDLLPQKVGNIRILSYGYDSKITRFIRGANKNGIYQYAENLLSALDRIRENSGKDVKIIFVAHSLGGIIVKEVLRQSSKHTHQPHLLSIFKATYGIIFFGCPHQGSGATEWGLVATNIAKLAGMSPNEDLLRSLGIDSPTLRIISSDFSVFMRDNAFKVHSFREEKGMTGIRGVSGKVVGDISSIIGDATEGKEGISANHLDMCRFGSMEDEGFLKTAGVISRYVRELEALRNSQKVPTQQMKRTHCKKDVTSLSGEEKGCLQSFVLADYSTYRHRVPKRHSGTLEWIRRHEVYQEWISEDTISKFLWISGNPGCGKTVISAFLIDCLEESAKATDTNVAYFFCDDKDENQKSAQSLLRGLIHQLITATPTLIKHAMGPYTAQGQKMLESLDSLWGVFISVATDPISNGTYIILDALDECEKTSRDDLLRRLGNYFRLVEDRTNTYLRVLITSRPYREIHVLLQKQPTIRLKTENKEGNFNDDISSFVSYQVDELAEICGYDYELKEKVRKTLIAGADGMFLWVSLVVKELFDTSLSDVSETLATIPHSLDGLYTHLLKRLRSKNAKFAKKVLMWVVTAPRPMSVAELAIACSIKICHTSESAIENVLITGFKEDILLCGPILKIQGGTVYLIHQSAKEFLLSPELCNSLPDFSVPEEQRDHELAVTCLTYLSFDDFNCEPLNLSRSNHLNHPILHKHKFLQFSASFWPEFVRNADQGHQMIWQSFYRFSKSDERLKLAFNLFRWTNNTFTPIIQQDKLCFSVYCGIHSFVSRILEEEINANVLYLSGNLRTAASQGHQAVVQLLLEKGADVNDQGRYYGNALQAAAEHGHQHIIQLLLEKGADVNAHGGEYGSALQVAVVEGHQSIVQLLLEKGVDVNNQGGKYGNALQAAAARSHQSIAHLLLENGADVNAQGGEYRNALQAAAAHGHQPIIQLLLEKGADVNTQGGYYGNALQTAAVDGLQSIVQLLLDNGADVNAHGGEYGNALQAASRHGRQSIAHLLLEKGADVNAQGGYYGNALQAAAVDGHQPIFQLLLEKGADVNAQGGYYGNALQAAAKGGHQTFVHLLLEKGADVNTQGGCFGNALQAAAARSHQSIVHLLLENGADVNAQGGCFGNALQAAAARDHQSIIQLLLEKGADANAQGEYYRNAL